MLSLPLRNFLLEQPIALQTFIYVAALDGQLSSKETAWLQANFGSAVSQERATELAQGLDEGFLARLTAFWDAATPEKKQLLTEWLAALQQFNSVGSNEQQGLPALAAVAQALGKPTPAPAPLAASQGPRSDFFLEHPCQDPKVIETTRRLVEDWVAAIPFSPFTQFTRQTDFLACVEHASYGVAVSSQLESRKFIDAKQPHNGESVPSKPKRTDQIDIWSMSFPRYADFQEHQSATDLPDTRRLERCSSCNATGQVRCQCGNGKQSCSDCRGGGYITKTRQIIVLCDLCRGSGHFLMPDGRRETCPRCNGSGKMMRDESYSDPCRSCAASGKVTCSKCRGSLQVTCSSCNGKRNFLLWNVAQSFEDPLHNSQLLPAASLPTFPAGPSPVANLVGEALWQVDEANSIARLPFAREPAGARLVEAINDCRQKHTPHKNILRQRIEIKRCILREYRYRHAGDTHSIFVNSTNGSVGEADGPISRSMADLKNRAAEARANGAFGRAFRLSLQHALVKNAKDMSAGDPTDTVTPPPSLPPSLPPPLEDSQLLSDAERQAKRLALPNMVIAFLALGAASAWAIAHWAPGVDAAYGLPLLLSFLGQLGLLMAGHRLFFRWLACGGGVGLSPEQFARTAKTAGLSLGLVGAATATTTATLAIAAFPKTSIVFALIPSVTLGVLINLAFRRTGGNVHLTPPSTLVRTQSKEQLSSLIASLNDEATNYKPIFVILLTALLLLTTIPLAVTSVVALSRARAHAEAKAAAERETQRLAAEAKAAQERTIAEAKAKVEAAERERQRLAAEAKAAQERAIAEAKAAQSRAIAEAKAKAEAEERERQRLTAEAKSKRLDWTGSALRRAGMKQDTITRALTQGGNVVAWGLNNEGQTRVPAGLSGVVAIAAGDRHTVALKSDGTVVAWGWNSDGQTRVPAGLRGVVAIAAGFFHTVALKSDGTVVAWGENNKGQTRVPAGLSGVVAIAAGGSHTVALKSDGTVVAWGSNEIGQTTVPAGLSGVVAITAGGFHTVALKSDGTMVAWGSNSQGQTTLPTGLRGVVAMRSGKYHIVALRQDATVVAWGMNGDGQTIVPAGLSAVVAIAGGEYHTVALKSDGTVVAWGMNNKGQNTIPAGLSGVVAIAAGGDHTVALKLD